MTNRKNPYLFKTPYGFRIAGFLLLFVFINVHVSAQRLSKSDKKTVTTVCDSYLTLKAQFLQDSSSERLKQIVTDSLFDYFELQKTYLQKMRYIPHPNNDFYIESVNQIGQLAQCEIFNADTLLYTIALAQHDTGFVIIGFNQETDFRQYTASYKTQIDSLEEDEIKKNVVRTAVSNFVLGLNQFYLERNSMLLRKTTTELNYNILLTEFKSDSIEGYQRKKEMVIREMDEVVFVTDSTTDCHLSTNSGSTTINLIKRNGSWVVEGENGDKQTEENLMMAEIRKHELITIRDINKDIDSFSQMARTFFIEGNRVWFSEQTSPQVAELCELLSLQLGLHNNAHLRFYGFSINSYSRNYTFSEDFSLATILLNDVEVVLEKKDIWRVVSIDGSKSFNHPHWMTRHVRDYVKAFNIITYGIDETDSDVEFVIQVGDVDTSILDYLAHYKTPPHSAVSYGILFKTIDSLTRPSAHESRKRQRVYVQFVIELDGSISQVQIASSTHSEYNQQAVDILHQLPKWIPGVFYNGPVRSTFVLPIWF